MTTEELITQLEKQDYILPKDILSHTDIDTLILQIEEIYQKHKDQIKEKQNFRNKYMELISYIYYVKLDNNKPEEKLFSDTLINYLLDFPESA